MKEYLKNKMRYVGESVEEAQIRINLKRERLGRSLLRKNAGRKLK